MSTQELRYDWDYSDYARLPDDGNRYEVIDGELLVNPSPSPHHQRVSFSAFRCSSTTTWSGTAWAS